MDSSNVSEFGFEGFEVEDVVLAEEKLNRLLAEASDIQVSDFESGESDGD